MKNTNTLRFTAAATKLAATALVMLTGMAATHNAQAAEQVGDAELREQTGAVTYYGGACTTAPRPCNLEPCRWATPVDELNPDVARDVLEDVPGAVYQRCNGASVRTTGATASCKRNSLIYLGNREKRGGQGQVLTCTGGLITSTPICPNKDCFNGTYKVP